MEQHVLISEARNLLDEARNHEGFNRPSAAHNSLVKLRDLLNNELAADTADDQVIEKKLNPNGR